MIEIKKKLFLILLLFSMDAMANAIIHKCKWEEFNIIVTSNQSSNIFIEVFKDKTKVTSCDFKKDVYIDGSQKVTSDEVLTFSKNSCYPIYDKIADQINFIGNGFIKYNSSQKISYIYLIKNHQPLICNF